MLTSGGGFTSGFTDGFVDGLLGIPQDKISPPVQELVVEMEEPELVLEITQNETVTNGSTTQEQFVKVYR
jgi:hypothetical protein